MIGLRGSGYDLDDPRFWLWEHGWFPSAAARAKSRFEGLKSRGTLPRIAFVKQDCNEDLYCCGPDVTVPEMLRSTLLRPGPAALFTRFSSKFVLVRTESDPECEVWKEKATALNWCPEEWFRSFQDRVPGRSYGQADFAVGVDDVDWSDFDLVISLDVAVPERVTRRYPQVVWAYYVREVKAPSYNASLRAPLPGQDLFLKQSFAPRFARTPPHVIQFPYHLHYFGVFADAFASECVLSRDDGARRGVFVEHHTLAEFSDSQISSLERFGPVHSTNDGQPEFDEIAGKNVPVTTMRPDVLAQLHQSRYFVKTGGRLVYGTAMVEAIAAGAVAMGDASKTSHNFLYSRSLCAGSFDELIERLDDLELDRESLDRARNRQRALIDYLCFHRPALDLIDAWRRVRRTRIGN